MIIGISGLAGSGKDTAANFLIKNHGFVRVALADKLKRICKDVFDFSDEQLWGSSSHRNKPDERYPRGNGEFLTPRLALQLLGTEWGRNCYPDVWVDDAMRTARILLKKYAVNEYVYQYNMKRGLFWGDEVYSPADFNDPRLITDARLPKGVVISDVRFKNEIVGIRRAGGHLIRVKRGSGLGGAGAVHQSEAEQLDIPDSQFSAVIENQAISLEELEAEVTRVFHSLC